MFHKIARSGGTCRGPLQKSLWLVKDLCDLFSQKNPILLLPRLQPWKRWPLPAFLPCPPQSPRAATLVSSQCLFPAPGPLHTLCSLLAICLPLSPLSRHWFTFRESAQMSLCQGSLPGCSLHPELLCSIWYRYQYLSVCWIIN